MFLAAFFLPCISVYALRSVWHVYASRIRARGGDGAPGVAGLSCELEARLGAQNS